MWQLIPGGGRSAPSFAPAEAEPRPPVPPKMVGSETAVERNQDGAPVKGFIRNIVIDTGEPDVAELSRGGQKIRAEKGVPTP